MPARRHRSRTYKRRFIRTPGGHAVVHYKEGKVGVARCAMCGRQLGGVPRLRSSELRALPRSSRRPNRPYGGHLCPACARQVIKEAARA
ncbi:MAG: 50S ribosomal protein L34e [Candidatus Hodarchaeaceae archaeon]|nr:50S ribosomal protein L34e [Candidatus Hodarchaeaceae archaeon]